MLQAYTIPIEQQVDEIEGVVNQEASTTTGVVFFQMRNEFGLDQTAIRQELQTTLNNLQLPLRTITPPEGKTPQDMLSDLTPEVVLYLYAYSVDQDSPFLSQLTPEVWRSFSPEVLGALPDNAFDDLDSVLVAELQSKAVGEPRPLPNLTTDAAPGLPESWQMDRFETAQDLIELTGVRSLSGILNDFVDDGHITGPLGMISDLTPDDLAWIIDLERRCQEFTSSTGDCSMFAYLDGEAAAALLTQYSDTVDLPENLLAGMSRDDSSRVATAAFAQTLTGNRVERDAPLPDEWRFEAPNIITFSLSDIPLGVLSVSADEDQLSRDDLQHLVENEVVPQLEALEAVADVSVEGGEKIRPDLLNTALQAEGLEPISNGETSPTPSSGDQETSENSGEDEAGSVPAETIEEGPALPATWAAFAGAVPGAEELDTADDLLRIPGVTPSQMLNQAVEMAGNDAAMGTLIRGAIAQLTPEVLLYLAKHEEGFFENLSLPVLQAFTPETLEALPEEVQTRAATPVSPALGESWRRLAAEPELAGAPLFTAADLVAFGDGPASTLNQIVSAEPQFSFYAIQLISDLTPAVITYLLDQDGGFVGALEPEVFCNFSTDVLNMDEVSAVWGGQDWTCLQGTNEVALSDIASGEVQTAAESLIGAENDDRIHDPDAPALPASWPGIASFVGADELDTADDLFYTFRDGQLRTPSALLNGFVGEPGAESYVRALTPDVLIYVNECSQPELCEEGFFNNLSDGFLLMLSDETSAGLPEEVQARRETARLGTYQPEDTVTRTNGNNSLVLVLLKEGDANTVTAWDEVDRVLDRLKEGHSEIHFAVAFEQASYIEESISGVAREGGLGAIMAVIVILIFLNFSVRSTLVTAVSIPTSVALAFVLMKWLPGNMHELLYPLTQDATGVTEDILTFVLRLFPEDVSLNIMTLSGLTVAIGRVVDDAIVVLENIYRNIQKGEDRLEAVLQGTHDVSLAIFAATVTTVVVFLPIGLFGGVIGAFFLPFGLAVTYALMASFVVAITVVPLFAYLFISRSSLPEEHQSSMERGYRRVIQWALDHRWTVVVIATVAFVAGVLLLTQLPTAFLPSFGEPTITVSVSLPREVGETATTIAVTDAKVRRFEEYLQDLDGVDTIQTSVGGGGNNFVASDTIQENVATITVYVESQEVLDRLTPEVREEAQLIFNDLDRNGKVEPEQDNVRVSGASLSEQGFGGFAVVVSGDPDNPPTLAELQQYDAMIVEKLESIEGITNVQSSLAQITGSGGDVSQTYIRIDGIPAARYTAELETDDTLGLTQEAIQAVQQLPLPESFVVGEGFESQQQTEGFRQMFISMGIAVVIVYLVMVLTFGSVIHPVTILFSLPLAVVGASVGLAVTGRVLGLSSVVGLLMLVGIVVTNAIVLIDRVQTNRKHRGMSVREALVDGGATRLRPILMTAIATMVALLPLAVGLSGGAIIAAELGTVVIGGLFSSTLLTLVVVPVVYSIFENVRTGITRLLRPQ